MTNAHVKFDCVIFEKDFIHSGSGNSFRVCLNWKKYSAASAEIK